MINGLSLQDDESGCLSVFFGETNICSVREEKGCFLPGRKHWPFLFDTIKKDILALLKTKASSSGEELGGIKKCRVCDVPYRISESYATENMFYKRCPLCERWGYFFSSSRKETSLLRELEVSTRGF